MVGVGKSEPGKYLIVKGIAGIGNRLATACNAIEFAEKTKRTLLVDWSDPVFSDGVRNLFPEYFEISGLSTINGYDELPKDRALSVYPATYQGKVRAEHYSLYCSWRHRFCDILPVPWHRLPGGRLRMLDGYWVLRPPGPPPPVTLGKYLWGLLDRNNFPRGGSLSSRLATDIVIFADYIPGFDRETLRNHLRLTPRMANKIQDLSRQYVTDGTVGVHVRKTDKKPKRIDPIARVGQVLEEKGLKDRPIFLATDDAAIREAFIVAFPNTRSVARLGPPKPGVAIHHWSEETRDAELSRAILEETIADMWLLSACEYLIYQGNSAFTLPSRCLHPAPEKCIDWDT